MALFKDGKRITHIYKFMSNLKKTQYLSICKDFDYNNRWRNIPCNMYFVKRFLFILY